MSMVKEMVRGYLGMDSAEMHAIAHQKLRTVQSNGDCHLSVSRIQVNAICSAPSLTPAITLYGDDAMVAP